MSATPLLTGSTRDAALNAPSVLIVEDEQALGLLLAYNLEAEGYRVERVERGDSTLR